MNHQLHDRHEHTRDELQRIANHVLARAARAATGLLGLRPTPGGFSTIPFGPEHERLRLSGGLLIRESGTTDTWTRSITVDGATLAQLAAFAEVDLTAEFSAGHDTPPLGDVDEPITLHEPATLAIADWYATAAQALDRLVAAAPDYATPSLAQLWPEHFDIALDMAYDADRPSERRVNIGAPPGDGFHAAPYLYVGPWTSDRPGDESFWNAPFGAVVGYETIAAAANPVDAAVEFFSTGVALLAS